MSLDKVFNSGGREMLSRAKRKLFGRIDTDFYKARVTLKRFANGFRSRPVHTTPPSDSKKLELLKKIQDLAPWYQTVDFGHGIIAHATDKGGRKYSVYDAERGIAKWDRFIYPNLPVALNGARVLEIGANAGLNLIQSVRNGAVEAIGLEQSEHSVEQAQFVKETFLALNHIRHPVQVFKADMEEFDYQTIGNFDIVFCFSVIYHLGPGINGQWEHSKYTGFAEAEVFDLQINFLRRLSRQCRYLMFQAYTDVDRGRGSGKESLLKLMRVAELTVVHERTHRHRRGYVLTVKSPRYQGTQEFPVSRIINKCFMPVSKSAEREILEKYILKNQIVENQAILSTRYWKLRTGLKCTLGMPDQIPDRWWIVPWAYLPKESGNPNQREGAFSELFRRFALLAKTILRDGYDPMSPPIPGFVLIHPKYGKIFQCLDGNHRAAILSYLDGDTGNLKVNVSIWLEIHRDDLLDYPITRRLIENGYFTEDSVFEWFDRAFKHVECE